MEILPPFASRLLAVVLLFSGFTPALGQDAARKERERREKFETILRIQDSRSPVKGALQRALADADPLVRERAALACASLQDSSLLDLLTRLLEDPAVSPAAAFAIGQTGAALSPAGRERLENDLLWNRLRTTADVVALLDGLGRFCTAAGLEEMLNKLDAAPDAATTEGLLAALARSAVRGVTGDRAVRFLLRQTVPVERSTWVALYALQRTGQHPELLRQFDRLLPLRSHGDPLVRLNYAALLGKLAQSRDVRPLLQMMAESDPDRRVRIMALRSLAPIAEFDPDLFRRAILSSDQHIQVTALQGITGSQWLAGARSPAALQLFDDVERAARNTGGGFHWQVQSEAAVALAKLRGIAVPLPQTEEFGPAELRLLASTLPGDAVPVLVREAQSGPPRTAVAALEELLALARAHPADTSLRRDAGLAAAAALRRDDAAITATAASVLTDSLLLTTRTASLLLEALPEQNVSDDLEAILSIVDGLGAAGDTRAITTLTQLLRSPEPSVARSSARALQRITGRPFLVPEPGSPLHTDYDFERLWALPDTVRMTIETTRGWIRIELYPREAPFTVLNFIRLATERNYFNGLTFHRVVPNFVVQGGDPRGDGWGGPGYTIRSEFPRRSYGRGSIGMASAGKDTEGSQFFITHSPQPHLDGRYTLFGQVASGREVVDQLQVGDRIQAIRMGW